MKRVTILGLTGSIGQATIEIILKAPGEFEVLGLAAGDNIDKLESQLVLFPRAKYVLKNEVSHEQLISRDSNYSRRSAGIGQEGIKALIDETHPDLVVNALVGISGLAPTISALEAGCCVALANKESLVTAGRLIRDLISGRDDQVIPVDSEHFSLSRCLRGYGRETTEIILTASGGPFHNRKRADLARVTLEEVLDHPTWKMGKKVTVDSAHLLNKGLEVIEAHWLFNYPYDSIKVVIHPQSIVHSIIRLNDGSLLAHLGPADMRLPIMSALYYPEIGEYHWKPLFLEDLGRLEFIPFDPARFPAFELALEAARAGGTAPAVLNAADEVAVATFLSGNIGFLNIIDWIEEALSSHSVSEIENVDDVLAADKWARQFLAKRHKEAVST